MRTISKVAAYAIYYGVAYHLPENHWMGGRLWNAIRVWCARRLLRECGRNIHMDRRVNFGTGEKLTLKDRSGIGAYSRIIGDVTFCECVATGFGVTVTGYDRDLSRTDIPLIEQHVGFDAPVVLERDTVLFANSIVLPGVRVGEGSIVAAGAVVAKNVPPYAVVAGNPARVVKWRKPPATDTVGPGMVGVVCKTPDLVESINAAGAETLG